MVVRKADATAGNWAARRVARTVEPRVVPKVAYSADSWGDSSAARTVALWAGSRAD